MWRAVVTIAAFSPRFYVYSPLEAIWSTHCCPCTLDDASLGDSDASHAIKKAERGIE